MFRNLAKDITFFLVKNKIVDIEKREVYVYGLEVILLNTVLIAILMGVSLLFGAIIHFIAFLVFFFPLRIFAGGYHAKTSEKCLVLSTILYTASLVAVQLFPLLYNSVYAMAAGGVFMIIIFIFAPLVNKNNELNVKQIKRNRLITRLLLIIDLVLLGICYWQGFTVASSGIVLIGLVCVLLLLGKALTKFEGRKD